MTLLNPYQPLTATLPTVSAVCGASSTAVCVTKPAESRDPLTLDGFIGVAVGQQIGRLRALMILGAGLPVCCLLLLGCCGPVRHANPWNRIDAIPADHPSAAVRFTNGSSVGDVTPPTICPAVRNGGGCFPSSHAAKVRKDVDRRKEATLEDSE